MGAPPESGGAFHLTLTFLVEAVHTPERPTGQPGLTAEKRPAEVAPVVSSSGAPALAFADE
jgi:hypothetical protein